ncbi:MAG: ABC transporter ATP-binding protein [Hyphomicrobiales bacterium]|nr:MAG: ABC transporter ATP-binding protein [Hyphomicrobiales bacterium]
MLRLTGVSAGYGKTPVLHEVSLSVQRGGVTAVLGANGAGKTTTIRTICGLLPATGEIAIAGKNIVGQTSDRIARLGVAHVPDNRGTFIDLTVRENLLLGAHTRRDGEVEGDIERFLELFPRLKSRIHQQAGNLSGGEQQMLALSRALMLRPQILLLDEPSFGLAPKVVAEIFELLRKVKEEDGLSVLLVEQNARMALMLSDKAYVLESGKVVLSGDSRDLASDDAIRKSYLGY